MRKLNARNTCAILTTMQYRVFVRKLFNAKNYHMKYFRHEIFAIYSIVFSLCMKFLMSVCSVCKGRLLGLGINFKPFPRTFFWESVRVVCFANMTKESSSLVSVVWSIILLLSLSMFWHSILSGLCEMVCMVLEVRYKQ